MNFKLFFSIASILLTFSNINANECLYTQQSLKDNAVLSERILDEIGQALNSHSEIIQVTCENELANLTDGAYAVAEQMNLAAHYLQNDTDPTVFKEHAEVFNMVLNILIDKAKKSEITNNEFRNRKIKLYLENLNHIH